MNNPTDPTDAPVDPSTLVPREDPSISGRCAAKSSRTGDWCGRWPLAGAKVCASHGGRAPAVKAAAARRIAEARAEKLLAQLIDPDAPPVTDPLGELAKRAGQTGSMVDSLMARVNALEKLEYSSESGTRQLVPLVAALERVLALQRGFVAELARAGIEDRAVRLEEARLEVVVGVLRAVGAGFLARVLAEVDAGAAVVLRASWPAIEGEVIGGAVRELAAAAGGGAGAGSSGVVAAPGGRPAPRSRARRAVGAAEGSGGVVGASGGSEGAGHAGGPGSG